MEERKHNKNDLAQMQGLPLSLKIRLTQDRIKGWYDNFGGDVYVAVSGGKDSQVLADIVKQMYPDVPLVFVDTGLEYNSVRNKGKQMDDEILLPKMNFVDVVLKYGYPIISKEIAQMLYECQKRKLAGKPMPCYRYDKLMGTFIDKNTGKLSQYNITRYAYLLDAPFMISHKCCDVMKKSPSKSYEKKTGFKPFLGTLASDSRLRETKWFKFGCNAFEEKRPTSQPLSFWTEQDILHYIREYDIDIADAYGQIVVDDKGQYATTKEERTGCIFCLFGITKDPDRLLRLKENDPMKYDFVMRGGKFGDNGMWIPAPDQNGKMGLGFKFVIDWLNEHGHMNIKY